MKYQSFVQSLLMPIVLQSLLFPGLALSQNQWSTKFSFEQQYFWQNPAFDHQISSQQSSISLTPDWYWSDPDANMAYRFEGFYRYDSQDQNRSHADIRHLYVQYEQSGWSLTLGINKVFWGIVESRHLVDVINQTDYLEDIDLEDKLGQPMLKFTNYSDLGELSLFLLPGFREIQFNSENSRFRTPLVVDTGQTQYESTAEDRHLDWALRYTQVLGAFDIGASYFSGTSREARLIHWHEAGKLTPVYDLMRQFGIDIQYTGDTTLLKLESIHRHTRIDSFFAGVLGAEHTFYSILNSSIDCGLIIEYLFDERNRLSTPTSFDKDIFIGSRLTYNDVHDSYLIGGVIIDVDHGQTFLNIEGRRRLLDQLVAEVELRVIANENFSDPLFSIAQDDVFRLTLSWYF